MTKIKDYITQHHERFLEELFHILRIPSVSADAKYKNLSMAIVPLDTPGIEIFDLDHIGLRYAKAEDVVSILDQLTGGGDSSSNRPKPNSNPN